MVSAKVARSSRNGQAKPVARPVAVVDGDVVLAEVKVERNGPSLTLASFKHDGEFHALTVEPGPRRRGNASYLLYSPRMYSVRIFEVAYRSEFDEDDTCTCATYGKHGQCRHIVLIRHLFTTEQLPD